MSRLNRMLKSVLLFSLVLACAASARADVHVRPNEGAALSGRTIVFSPGHGIFYDTGLNRWRFQRGILHELREDIHTNEIFIEYIQRYLANAGARVESVRERGFQDAEVIVDNGGAGYSETGAWSSSTSAAARYGQDYRYASADLTETAAAWFRPDLPKAGYYPVYVWFSASANRASDATYTVYHSGGETQVSLDQSGGLGDHFVFIGEYHFEAGQAGAVKLSNASSEANKVVIADAVRFGGGVGASGLPRWQEAAVEFLPHKGYSSGRGDVTIRPSYATWLAGGDTTRWRSDVLYFALHTNAGGGGTATGLSTFSYSNGRTPSWGSAGPAHYPTSPSPLEDEGDALRASVHAEVLAAVRAAHESSWRDRSLHKMNFGELREARNMPSALIELGFHDSADDAALLSSARFRHDTARAIYKGILKYWAPGAAIVPLPPQALSLTNLGGGQLRISWEPTSDPIEASATPSSYKVYLSRNGRGFDDGTVTSSTSLTLSNLADGDRVFVRVAALNSGGESLLSGLGGALIGPSQDLLIVDGFDREYKHAENNITSRYTRDYAIEHVDALAWARPTAGIDFAANEAIINGSHNLQGYRLVDWALGREGSIDQTFDATEQQVVEAYLMAGGRLLTSGTEIGWDLQARNGGPRFFNEVLGASYVGDDSGSLTILADPAGPLTGVGGFELDDGQQGRYMAASPDRLAPSGSGAMTALAYATSDAAGIAVDRGAYRVVVFGFPLETVTDAAARRSLTERAVDFLLPVPSAPPTSGGGSSNGGSTGGATNPPAATPPAAPPAPVAAASGGGGSGGGGCDVLPHGQDGDPLALLPFALLLLALLALRPRS